VKFARLSASSTPPDRVPLERIWYDGIRATTPARVNLYVQKSFGTVNIGVPDLTTFQAPGDPQFSIEP
jgi:hypothetical protein